MHSVDLIVDPIHVQHDLIFCFVKIQNPHGSEISKQYNGCWRLKECQSVNNAKTMEATTRTQFTTQVANQKRERAARQEVAGFDELI